MTMIAHFRVFGIVDHLWDGGTTPSIDVEVLEPSAVMTTGFGCDRFPRDVTRPLEACINRGSRSPRAVAT